MLEVCWAPMLAAFSVTLGQTDDEVLTFECLQGFRHAIQTTAVMGMQTQRDAFVTSLAKFTSLHSAADIKQKNIGALKVSKDFWYLKISSLLITICFVFWLLAVIILWKETECQCRNG